MKIEFKNILKIKTIDIDCKISIEKSKVHLLSGENGIGKSSLLQYLKLHQEKYFGSQNICFVDQFPLQPINGISLIDIQKILKDERFQSLDIFDELVGELEEFNHLAVNSLSGGQNQKVKIMLSLYLSGDIFIYDEPLQYLDSKNVGTFIYILKELKKLDKSIIIVEHRSELLRDLIDKEFKMLKVNDDTILIRNKDGL